MSCYTFIPSYISYSPLKFIWVLALALGSNVEFASAQKSGLTVADDLGLEMIAQEYWMSHTGLEFLERTEKGLRPQDVPVLKSLYRKLTVLPVLERVGPRLTLQQDGMRMSIDVSRYREGIFLVDHIKYRYDKNLPLEAQIKQLRRLLTRSDRSKWGMYFELFENPAYAMTKGELTNLFIGVTVGNIMGLLMNSGAPLRAFCGLAGMKYYELTGLCKETLEQMGYMVKKPEIVAAKSAVPESKPPEEPVVPTDICPHHALGAEKDKVYRGIYYFVNEKRRFIVLANFDGETVKDIRVFDSSRPIEKVPQVATFNLDSEKELSSIRVPNPKLVGADEAEKMSLPPEVELNPAQKYDDPQFASLQKIYLTLFSEFGGRLNRCRVEKRAADASKAKIESDKQGGKPSGPGPGTSVVPATQ